MLLSSAQLTWRHSPFYYVCRYSQQRMSGKDIQGSWQAGVYGMVRARISAQVPLAVIGGHSKAVSYVRWMDGSHLVSASTDNQLKLWDLAAAARHTRHQEWRPTTVLTGESAHPLNVPVPLPRRWGKAVVSVFFGGVSSNGICLAVAAI